MLFLSLLTFLNTCVISTFQYAACYIIVQVFDIYIKNNKGTNTDPCVIPLKTDFQFETSPSTTVRYLLSVSHCSIQSIMLSPIPWAFNLSSNL